MSSCQHQKSPWALRLLLYFAFFNDLYLPSLFSICKWWTHQLWRYFSLFIEIILFYDISIIYTRIFGAYGPIMFALRVWVGFGASWRGGPLRENCIFLSIPTWFQLHVWKDTWHHVRKDTFWVLCSEGHIELCSEGHFSEYDK